VRLLTICYTDGIPSVQQELPVFYSISTNKIDIDFIGSGGTPWLVEHLLQRSRPTGTRHRAQTIFATRATFREDLLVNALASC
jgi:hypothetical protein